jgi:Family of unknown function (DUF5652)
MEDVMAVRRWSDLNERTRKRIIIVGVGEGLLKIAALIDIKRRPAAQIRGRKWVWATAVAVVNSAGLLPIVYFVRGRRSPSSQA